jgi:rod shape-determining protein MreC
LPSHESDPRPLLLGGPALGLRLIVLGAMAAGLMVADHRQHHLSAIRDGIASLAYPIQWAVSAPVKAWDSMRESFATKTRVEAENVKLAADNLVLRLKLLRFESLEQENRRLRAVREASPRAVQRSLVAEIVRVDLDPFRQRVLVNKGTREGVFRGQAAIDAAGIFGQVTRAGPFSAELILISDPESAIPVQVNRTGARSIALGTGRSGLLSLPYLPQNADVIVGDLLVSSGLGGVYPPGYPVGKVTAVTRDPGQPLLAIEAAPLAGLDRDPEILLVWFDRDVIEPEPAPEPEREAPAKSPPPAAAPREQPPARAPANESPPAQAPAAESEPAPAQDTAAPPPEAADPGPRDDAAVTTPPEPRPEAPTEAPSQAPPDAGTQPPPEAAP